MLSMYLAKDICIGILLTHYDRNIVRAGKPIAVEIGEIQPNVVAFVQ